MTDADDQTTEEQAPGPQTPETPPARPKARERGRMRRRLREQQRMREALLVDLGALVFELHRHGRREPKLLQAKAAELSAVDAEVRALSEALDQDVGVVELVAAGIAGSCTNCGMLLSTEASFCASCGAPAKAGLEPAVPAGPALASAPEASGEPIDAAAQDTVVVDSEPPEGPPEPRDADPADTEEEPWFVDEPEAAEPEPVAVEPVAVEPEQNAEPDSEYAPEQNAESDPEYAPEPDLEPEATPATEADTDSEPDERDPEPDTDHEPQPDTDPEPERDPEPDPSAPAPWLAPSSDAPARPVRVKRQMGRFERTLRGKKRGRE